MRAICCLHWTLGLMVSALVPEILISSNTKGQSRQLGSIVDNDIVIASGQHETRPANSTDGHRKMINNRIDVFNKPARKWDHKHKALVHSKRLKSDADAFWKQKTPPRCVTARSFYLDLVPSNSTLNSLYNHLLQLLQSLRK